MGDSKGHADHALIAVSAAYMLSVIFRRSTKYKATIREVLTVLVVLVVLSIGLPILFGSV